MWRACRPLRAVAASSQPFAPPEVERVPSAARRVFPTLRAARPTRPLQTHSTGDACACASAQHCRRRRRCACVGVCACPPPPPPRAPPPPPSACRARRRVCVRRAQRESESAEMRAPLLDAAFFCLKRKRKPSSGCLNVCVATQRSDCCRAPIRLQIELPMTVTSRRGMCTPVSPVEWDGESLREAGGCIPRSLRAPARLSPREAGPPRRGQWGRGGAAWAAAARPPCAARSYSTTILGLEQW